MDRHWRFARAEDKLARLSKQGLDMVAFWRACAPVLADAVPSDAAPCCFTLDPASGLVTSHFNEEMLVLPPEWIANEYMDDDVNKLTDVARSPSGVSTLYEATGGDPSSSPRWHALMADGGDQGNDRGTTSLEAMSGVPSPCTGGLTAPCSTRTSRPF